MATNSEPAAQRTEQARLSHDSEIKHAGADQFEGLGLEETHAAIIARNKPNPWGKGYIRLYFLAGFVFLNSTMNGFDASLLGSINALPNYTTYYNLPKKGATSTGIVFAIYQVGQMAGSLFVWIADWRGRKFLIFLGTIGVCVATVITATAKTLGVFIGGRFLLSFFATLAHMGAVIYLVEMAPTLYRGTLAGLYNTFYYFGSILATSAVYGAHLHLSNRGNDDWRIPLWLQMVCPGLVSCVILFFPESPRWLIAKDRHEEAKLIIARYHANDDIDHPLVSLEMKEMIASLQFEGMTTWKDFFNFKAFVRTRSRRYRVFLGATFSWFGQFSGNNIVSYYLPTMLTNVGIVETNMKLLLNIIYALVGWIFATAGTRFHDVIGRRKMFMISTAGMVLALSVVAGTAAEFVRTESKSASTASIVFIYIFGAVFAFAYTSMQPIYPTEIMANDMRAKGAQVYKLVAGASGFLNTFVGPIALQNIGYWFYVFFVFWDVFEFIIIYFFFVETRGLSLEELDVIFEAKNPRKASAAAVRRLHQSGLVQAEGNTERVEKDGV